MIHIENKCRTWNTHLHLFKSILLFEHPFHHSVRPSQGFQDTHSKLDVSHTSILWWNLRFATFCHRQWWRPWKEVLGGSCYLEGRFPNEGSYIKPNSPTTFKDVADCFPVLRLFLVHCFYVYIYILIFWPKVFTDTFGLRGVVWKFKSIYPKWGACEDSTALGRTKPRTTYSNFNEIH